MSQTLTTVLYVGAIGAVIEILAMLIIVIKIKKLKVCTTEKKKRKKKAIVSHGHLDLKASHCAISVLETFLLVLLLAKEHFFKIHFIVLVLPQYPVE